MYNYTINGGFLMREKKNNSKKILIIGIIFLFVGASVVSGFSVKIKNQASTSSETSTFVATSDTSQIITNEIDILDPIEIQNSGRGDDDDWNYWSNPPNMYANVTGNIGIGTTNPLNLFHIVGSSSVPLVSIEQTGSHRGLRVNTSSACAIWVENAGNHGLRITNANGDGVHITNANSDGVYVESAGGWAGYFNGDGYFGGDVGIGTTTPDSPLEVSGVIHSSSGGFQFPDGTTQITAATGGGSGNTLDQAYDQGGAGAGRTITADSGPINIIGPDGLTVSGNVGINTTSPLYELDVDGQVNADGYIGDDITFQKDEMSVWRIYADLYYLYLQNMVTGSKYIFVLAAAGSKENAELGQTSISSPLEQEIENLRAENAELQQRIENLENAIYQIYKLNLN
jgi:hypothetical protein